MKLASLIAWSTVALVASAGSYAPTYVGCPSNISLIREGKSISAQESAWLKERHKKTEAAIQAYLMRVGVEYNQTLFNNQTSTNNQPLPSNQNYSKPINIGLAFSGGGLRAMLTGAGQMAALDNRSSQAAEVGLGGILQSSSYIAGLSGGAWLISSLVYQNWPTIDEVVLENPYRIWDYSTLNTFFNTSNPFDFLFRFASNDYEKTLSSLSWWNMPYGEGIKDDLERKKQAGFPVSITDAWGRILAHSLFRRGGDNWLEGATWSGIQDMSAFSNHNIPFPIITALAQQKNSITYNLNLPVVEFNPYEMGSFDTSINTFHDMKFLGTPLSQGYPRGLCTQGYDNAAFVVGTSSSLFNQFINTLVCPSCNTLNTVVKFFVRRFLKYMSRHHLDVAWYYPNPFFASPHGTSLHISTSDTLYLMDGGLAGETVPISTLAVKEREMDLIFAFDNDGPEWPSGTSLINTYQRQFAYEGASTLCPYVPGQSTFIHRNLTAKPTFFGCDARNLTALTKDGVVPPIVIYVANRPYEFFSNTSTFKLTYSDHEKKGMVVNGFNIATRGNKTTSPDWQVCVGCAMIRRAEERNNIQQSEQCKRCFDHYCWDGVVHQESAQTPLQNAPVNFTIDGLTNEPMTLDKHNAYIHKTGFFRSLF
ncbi:hypothetical protein JCM33374_g2694 [Metschnikowia sp. JCM 33374]|nr:hypothetical protein JCM33374_g2694 [Metschnikowia sp. JCM 33374]